MIPHDPCNDCYADFIMCTKGLLRDGMTVTYSFTRFNF